MVKIVDESGSRTLVSTAANTAWVGALPIIALGVGCYFLAINTRSSAPFVWWPLWGEKLLDGYPWFISLSITATVAFLAADLGGQILRRRTPGSPTSSRAEASLIAVSLGLWAFTPIIVVLIVAYVLVHIEDAPLLLMVFPAAALQFFLTARVGTLHIPDLPRELAAARYAVVVARHAVAFGPPRSRRPVLLTLGVDAGLLAILGAVTLSAHWDTPFVALAALSGTAQVALWATTLVFAFQVAGLASLDRTVTRLLARCSIVLAFAPFLTFCVSVMLATDRAVVRSAIGTWVGICVATLVVGVLPPRLFSAVMVDWTITGAASRVAHKWAMRRASERAREYARLRRIVARSRAASQPDLSEIPGRMQAPGLQITNAPLRRPW